MSFAPLIPWEDDRVLEILVTDYKLDQYDQMLLECPSTYRYETTQIFAFASYTVGPNYCDSPRYEDVTSLVRNGPTFRSSDENIQNPLA